MSVQPANTDSKSPKLISDPLIHFLIAGAVLFLLLSWFAPEEESERVIRVDREQLLTFIQYRTKVFQPELAAQKLDAMSTQQRENLIRDYIEEEALYREAIAMGLEGDDYVIRRRMVQKLEFITQGFVEQGLDIQEDELLAFFKENQSDYYIDPSVTFTHVYIANEEEGDVKQRAQEQLKQLHDNKVSFSEGIGYGDRFPFHVNYVDRTPEFVASHFGQAFADEVFALPASGPGSSQWYGPFQSQYGLHLVNVSHQKEGRSPELDEVTEIVAQDYRQATIRKHQRQAIDDIISDYTIANELETGSP